MLGFAAAAAGAVGLATVMLEVPISAFAYDLAYLIPYGSIILGLAWLETAARPITIRNQVALLAGESSFALYLIHVAYGTALFGPVRTMLGSDLTTSVWLLTFLMAASAGLHLGIERPLRSAARLLLVRALALHPNRRLRTLAAAEVTA
jgi:peptidoglycan/LPS O-acetylase OafA/YrhL